MLSWSSGPQTPFQKISKSNCGPIDSCSIFIPTNKVGATHTKLRPSKSPSCTDDLPTGALFGELCQPLVGIGVRIVPTSCMHTPHCLTNSDVSSGQDDPNLAPLIHLPHTCRMSKRGLVISQSRQLSSAFDHLHWTFPSRQATPKLILCNAKR